MSDNSLNKGFDPYVVDTLFKRGDVEKISTMLSNKELDLNQIDQRGYTILMEAFEKAPISVVKLLVESGADVHHRPKNDYGFNSYIDFCFFLPNEDCHSKIAYLANCGVKMDVGTLELLNDNENILSTLDIDKIFAEYGEEIADKKLINLIPQSIKDIFFQ